MVKEKELFERELFQKALKSESEFSKYRLEDLETLGIFLGRYDTHFKRIYSAYRDKEPNVEIKLQKGAPLNIAFNWESKEAIISSGSNNGEIKFTLDLFLTILGLIDLCFGRVLPTGSVVELDMGLLPETLSSVMSQARAVIVNQKAMLHQDVGSSLYIDYVANLWPHANQGNIPPIFLSNVMVKSVIHKGHSTDEEREYVQNIKEVIVNTRQKSITFMSEKELKRLEEMMVVSEEVGVSDV